MPNSPSDNVEILIEQLLSVEAYKRRIAAEELGVLQIRTERVYNALKVVAESDPNKIVRQSANHALVLLGYLEEKDGKSIPLKEPKMLLATEIIRYPSYGDNYPWKYMMIYDQTIASDTFHNLIKAICILGDRGWRAISITPYTSPIDITSRYMCALLEKTASDETIKHTTNGE